MSSPRETASTSRSPVKVNDTYVGALRSPFLFLLLRPCLPLPSLVLPPCHFYFPFSPGSLCHLLQNTLSSPEERSKNKVDFEGKGKFLLVILGPGRDLLRENRANPDMTQGLKSLTHKLKEIVSGPKASGQDNPRQESGTPQYHLQ